MTLNSITTTKKINANNAVIFNKQDLNAADAEYGDIVEVTMRVVKKREATI